MILIIIGIILVIWSMFLSLKITCNYEFVTCEKHVLFVELALFHMTFIRRKYNFIKETQSKWPLSLPEFHRLWQNEKTKLKRKITVKDFSVKTVIGTSDVISTGVLTAVLLAVKKSFVFILPRYAKVVCQPYMQVEPVFQGATLETKCRLILKIRFIDGLNLYLRMRKHFRQ